MYISHDLVQEIMLYKSVACWFMDYCQHSRCGRLDCGVIFGSYVVDGARQNESPFSVPCDVASILSTEKTVIDANVVM